MAACLVLIKFINTVTRKKLIRINEMKSRETREVAYTCRYTSGH